MRIFERLRGRDRGIERKLMETIAGDLLRRIDDEVPAAVVADAKPGCCSCCSASEKTHQ
ncbi:hypothetical protein [Bradyrhizobium canariense]|uniref:hypothetical protein n=1 Tax=Bradyrhizobium canariense TaxID=255045 RepID=UPI001B8A81B0|nr:hypothetical protein [Bradyrhizobium canariense]MBR0952533.1 hypothetical protein [Bradyrhizobium canariense]